MRNEYCVYVRCFTYNQASFIEDAMNGFCMQETTFPFVCIIVDDGSTDGEQETIKNYLLTNFDLNDDIITRQEETKDYFLTFSQHKKNKNCFFAVLLLKYNHNQLKKSKFHYIKEWMDNATYAALCEGDDYWIDPYKLKKQVEFMETHTDYSMCFHAVNDVYSNGTSRANSRYIMDNEECPIEDYFKYEGAYAPTCSMLFRGDALSPKPSYFEKTRVGDSPMILTMFLRGKVCFLSDIMACYRVNAAGSWSQRQKKLSFRQIIEKHKENRAYWHEVDRYTEGKYSQLVRKREMHTWLSLGKSLYYFTINSFKKLFKL